MKAFKCDRCGSFYEDYTEKDKAFYISTSRSNNWPFDLCPECNKGLKDWFEEKGNDDDD